MSSVEDGEDDLFFDSFDCARASCADSSSSEEDSFGSRSLKFEDFPFAFGHRELKSVHERRIRFLRGMGFKDDLLLSLGNGLRGVEEGAFDMAPKGVESEKTVQSDAGLSESLQAEVLVGGRDSGDLGNGAGQPCMLGEFGSNALFLGRRRKIRDSIGSSIETDSAHWKERRKKWIDSFERKCGRWWRGFFKKTLEFRVCKNNVSAKYPTMHGTMRTQIRSYNKRCMEFAALFKDQEISAHKGLIRTLRFNYSGWYLASGGDDCIVRIWQVIEEEASSCKLVSLKNSFLDDVRDGKLASPRKRCCGSTPVVIPKMMFRMNESPLHEFCGHSSGILDLSWSSCDFLLSSSKDKTVRLWKVGCDYCLKIFQHNDYVTCIQFNPVNEKHFISGSIDGKVRIWGVSVNRVLDWADLREIVTAVSYKPDGMGFLVGSIRGNCRIFDCSCGDIRLIKELQIQEGKKSSGRCITGLQFCPDDSRRIMINSADSNIRIINGLNVSHKFRGLRISKSQPSASFTWDGRYAVSVDEGSHIYIWNTGAGAPTKGVKTVRSCELFSSSGATVAVPWRQTGCIVGSSLQAISEPPPPPPPPVRLWYHRGLCPGSRFLPESSSKGSVTWPEEKLGSWRQLAAWGLVIVSASDDGTIRAYHNYGLPVRLSKCRGRRGLLLPWLCVESQLQM